MPTLFLTAPSSGKGQTDFRVGLNCAAQDSSHSLIGTCKNMGLETVH
jgi:hypothetical protein